ncbi:EpsG family protein [Enterobacter ludwigii]
MFVLFLILPLLPLTLIWHRVENRSRNVLSLMFIVTFSLLFTAYYLNGMDWSIYFLKFIDENDPYSSFEIGFVAFFKSLLFISGNNYGFAILIYYLICFSFLRIILKRFVVNEPLFWVGLFLLFGYTLILEQLRQLIACIIVFYSILNFDDKKNKLQLILLLLLAATFHTSALIMIPAVFLALYRNINLFITVTLTSIIGVIAILFIGYSVVLQFSQLSFVFAKLAYYMSENPISLVFGWLNIIDILFILFYIYYRHSIDRDENVKFLARLIFIGAVIHLFSGTLTFLARVSFYFYFLAIFLYCFSLGNNTRRYFAIKNYNTLILSLFFISMLLLSFLSYFRNTSAPIAFDNLTFRLTPIFDDAYVHKLANEKFFEANQKTSGTL